MNKFRFLTAIAAMTIIALVVTACANGADAPQKISVDKDVTVAIYQTKDDNGNYVAVNSPIMSEQVHVSELVIYPDDAGMITMPFNFKDTDKYAKITEQNLNRRIAISINGTVVYTPLIKMKLENGACSVIMTKEQVKQFFSNIEF